MDTLETAEIGLLEIRAASVAMQDAVSADLIRQAGASDVAELSSWWSGRRSWKGSTRRSAGSRIATRR